MSAHRQAAVRRPQPGTDPDDGGAAEEDGGNALQHALLAGGDAGPEGIECLGSALGGRRIEFGAELAEGAEPVEELATESDQVADLPGGSPAGAGSLQGLRGGQSGPLWPAYARSRKPPDSSRCGAVLRVERGGHAAGTRCRRGRLPPCSRYPSRTRSRPGTAANAWSVVTRPKPPARAMPASYESSQTLGLAVSRNASGFQRASSRDGCSA